MIWLGNVVPNYATKSVALFKNKYPDYDINFIKYNITELMRVYDGHIQSDIDKVLYQTIYEIFHTTTDKCIYFDYIKNQKLIYGQNMKNLMLLSDIFRLELLNTFGGIYIDVDSIPGITFDDILLNSNRFCVSRKCGQKIIADNYFMGQSENYDKWLNPMIHSGNLIFDTTKNDILFQYRKAKFLKEIQNDFSNQFYIEHYMIRTWEIFGGKTVDDFHIKK